MGSMAEKRGFDDAAREGLQLLLENFWLVREEDPEGYQTVREREAVLRDYVLDKFGYHLIVHRHFVKLEKIPARTEPWMGIEQFQNQRDYAILCCLLAFLEEKAVDEQFLLSHLCSEVQALYPGELPLDWRSYEHRKSLVRVLQFMTEMKMLRVVDGDTSSFNFNESSEVLYEATVMARYFMRSYPKDLAQFASKEELLTADLTEEETGAARRYRVYRQLVLTPVCYQEEMGELDFLYLRNYRNRLQEDLELHTGYCLELYKQTAILTAQERKASLTLFPDQRAICDIALQFAGLARERQERLEWRLEGDGSIRLTPVEFTRAVEKLRQELGGGWSKQYRESLIRQVRRELLELLLDWKMAAVEEETGRIILRPALARLRGEYPPDFAESRQGWQPEGEHAPSEAELDVFELELGTAKEPDVAEGA